MTGRDNIEASLSARGTQSIPVIIPYESILVRDRWEELVPNPWWDLHSPDLQVQMQWRRKVLKRIENDSLAPPLEQEDPGMVLQTGYGDLAVDLRE